MIRLEERKSPQENFFTQKFYPKKVVVPLSQHTGKPARILVSKSQKVTIGQIIGEKDGFISSNIHSPITGKIIEIKDFNHHLLKRCKAILIESEKEEDFIKEERKDIESLNREDLLKIIEYSGIVGLGGACFPTHVKLSPPKKIDTLIINGCECEPYLTCDYRLMVEHTESIIKGIELVVRILNPQRVIIAIENNKPEAVKRFNSKLHTKKYNLPQTKVEILPSSYPQGGEKQLIYNLLKRKVPADGLPFDVGVVVQNVGTCFAIYEAIYFKKPLIERIITFAGSSLKEPKNLWIRVGTLISELFERGVLQFKHEPKKIILGGPMMGKTIESLDYPLTKGVSGVLFFSSKDVEEYKENNCNYKKHFI